MHAYFWIDYKSIVMLITTLLPIAVHCAAAPLSCPGSDTNYKSVD